MGKNDQLKRIKKSDPGKNEKVTKEVVRKNDTKTSVNLKKSKNKKRIRSGCWSKDEIQESITKLEKKLEDTENKLSKSKKRRILTRLSKLRKGLKGEVEIGGQIQKSIKTIKREMKLKDINSRITVRKNSNVICLCCRKKGHQMIDCKHYKPLIEKNSLDSNDKYTCFMCGENGHTLKDCKKPRNDNSVLPFATCFKCGKTGHIVAYCPINESGSIYPKGGSCNLCGSVKHLSKNCDKNPSNKTNSKNSRGSDKKVNPPADNNNIDDPDLMWNNIIG